MSSAIVILPFLYAKLKIMEKKKRSVIMLLFGLLMLIALGYFLYAFSPNSILPNPIPTTIQPIYIFFTIFFLFLFFIGTFLLNHLRRGVLFALFLCCYMLLRLNHLGEIYFLLILLALFVSLEFFFTRYH